MKEMAQKIYIKAGSLIDGVNDVFKDAVIEITDKLITNVGNSEDITIPDNAIVYETPVVMPGLWDCHVHLFGGTTTDMVKWMEEPTSLRAMRTTISVRRLIEAGFTSIRDVGGPYAVRLKYAINEGTIPGPHIYAAHKFISQTAGHGDNHPTRLSWQNMESAEWYSRLADGVDECRKAAREQIREGADLLKIYATGGVLSHIDSPTQAHFTMDELRAIVEEAQRFDMAVAAHAHGLKGIKNAIAAGVTTIEHGTYIDDKTAEEMVKKNVILVPTFHILQVLLNRGKESGLPDHILAKVEESYTIHQSNIKIAIEKGVKIAAGTDLMGIRETYEHGIGNAAELVHLNEAGLTKLQAIQAATSMGPKTLGPRASNTGILTKGKNADILCLKKNPLDDLKNLQQQENIFMVFKSGKLVVQNGKIID